MSCMWLLDDDDHDDDDDYHDEDEEDMNIYDEVFVAGGGKNSFTFHRLTNLGEKVLAEAMIIAVMMMLIYDHDSGHINNHVSTGGQQV